MTVPQCIPTPDMPQEEWRPVIGWERLYEVSSLGRVRRACGGMGTHTGRILAPVRHGDGYPQVGLPGGVKQKTVRVHILVAAAFLGSRPRGLVINHKDANKANARADNLEYISQGDNCRHAAQTGRPGGARGERHPFARLTVEQAREIRDAPGSSRQIARHHGVSSSTVCAIKRGEHWAVRAG